MTIININNENVDACIVFNFLQQDILNKHKENCIVINGQQAVKMPNKGEKILFKHYQRQLQAPFVIFADFEAITEKVQSYKPNDNDSYTDAYQKHSHCSYGYYSRLLL